MNAMDVGRHRAMVILLGIPGLLLGALAGGFWLWTDGPIEREPSWELVEVDGADVRLRYVGSVCQEEARVDVDEESDRVVLTVHAEDARDPCVAAGVYYYVDVRLADPVADRELVDGS